jgi:hypothetical protein
MQMGRYFLKKAVELISVIGDYQKYYMSFGSIVYYFKSKERLDQITCLPVSELVAGSGDRYAVAIRFRLSRIRPKLSCFINILVGVDHRVSPKIQHKSADRRCMRG